MRIFLTLHPSANLSVPGSMTWYNNLYEPLLDLGHEVVLLRMDEVAIKYGVAFRGNKFKEIFCEEIHTVFINEHRKKPFDLFLSYVIDQDIDVNLINLIKKEGVPTANFSCNNTHQFHLIKTISPFFDFNLHSEKNAALKFKEIEAKPVWFQMAANPKYYFPKNLNFKYDVSFIGAAYAKRSFYINHLVSNKIVPDCFGPNWLINRPNQNLKKVKKEIENIFNTVKLSYTSEESTRISTLSKVKNHDSLKNLRKENKDHLHYPVTDSEMVNIFNQSKINLGFLEVFSEGTNNKEIIQQHLHLREFEVPMCGGLYITNYSDELTEFYIPDKEVLVFKNENELVDKVKFYLANNEEAEKVRKAGYKRAITEHTYQQRFKNVLQNLVKN